VKNKKELARRRVLFLLKLLSLRLVGSGLLGYALVQNRLCEGGIVTRLHMPLDPLIGAAWLRSNRLLRLEWLLLLNADRKWLCLLLNRLKGAVDFLADLRTHLRDLMQLLCIRLLQLCQLIRHGANLLQFTLDRLMKQ
jgi:hypothetical protein